MARDSAPADDPRAPASTHLSAFSWLRRPGLLFVPGGGFESTRYLTKWLLLSGAIGLVAGVGAIAFTLGISWATQGFLGELVGYVPPAPLGEGAPTLMAPARPWLLPLVVALGGLISGLIVFTLAPEAEGHGTDAAIAAIHFHNGAVRPRIPPIKLIASAITIGSGGSGGREGPTAQISAGFASLLADWLKLDRQDRRVAVAAGMGAGIGAIFRAPLGGALMGAEILYLHDLEVEAIIPSLMASIIGYTVYGAFFGFTPIFGARPEIALGSPVQLAYYALLGLLCGLGGILYSRVFYGVTQRFHHVPLPRWAKPAIGGLLVGVLGLLVPGSLHMGYGWVQIGMDGQGLLGLPLWMVLVLPAAKILATSLSIGSGGSGGIFGPGMVIGGMLGASLWRVMPSGTPGLPPSPAPFVIVGMMALFGSIAHAPIAVMLMVAEMTGNLSMLAPAMVAVGVATALVGDHTIYRSQLPNRAASPAHRIRFSFPLLSSLRVRDAMQAIGPETTIDGIAGKAPRLGPEQALDEALAEIVESGMPALAVEADERLVGQLSARDVVIAYKEGLERGVHRSSRLPESTVLIEAEIEPGAAVAGRALRDAGFPGGVLVLSFNRDGETIFPTAATQLAVGDVLLLLVDRQVEAAVRQFLRTAGVQ